MISKYSSRYMREALLIALCGLIVPALPAGGVREYSPSPDAAALITEFKLFQGDLYRQFSAETDGADYVGRIRQWLLRTEAIQDDPYAYHYLRALINLESAIWLTSSSPSGPLSGALIPPGDPGSEALESYLEDLESYLSDAERSITLVIDAKPDFADAYALRAGIYERRLLMTPFLRIFLDPPSERLNRIALRLDDRNPRAHSNLANRFLFASGGARGINAVIAAHRNALHYAGPEDVAISVRSGLWLSYALTLVRKEAEAMAAIEEVLRISPRHPIALLVKEAIEQGIDPAIYLTQ